VAKARKLSSDSRFAELVDVWLDNLGTTKPAANTLAAYRRDLEGVAGASRTPRFPSCTSST
jgi:hypothetical protein